MLTTLLKKKENIIVMPDWSELDDDLSRHIRSFVSENPGYIPLGTESFNTPKEVGTMRSKNPRNAGATVEEMAEVYDDSIIRKVRKQAREKNADIVFLRTIRGYGRMETDASFYGKR